MTNKLELTVDEVPAVIYDLRNHATWGIDPGFYWEVLVDGEGQIIEIPDVLDTQRLIGPFDSTDAAFSDLQDFLAECDGVNHENFKDAA